MRVYTALIALAFLTNAAAADPADYDRTVAFGDSLSDNGNLATLVPGSVPPPYFNGRLSNGPTWIELLSDPTKSTNPDSSMNRFWSGFDFGAGGENVNAAIAGANTVGGSPTSPPSVRTQIGTFVGLGGTFGPHDLVSIQGGANDFFGFFSTTPSPTAAGISSFAITTGLNNAGNIELAIGAGAKTIIVSNLPNLGATPRFNGSPLSAQAGLLASATYNSTLDARTEALAAANPDVNLVQMDWFAALKVAVADPAAFGFTNVTQACLGNPACTNPDTFLFWDSVHPTAAGHEMLALYAGLLLSTEETGQAVGALGQVALSTRLEASDIIFRRAPVVGDHPSGLYAEVIGQTGSLDGGETALFGSGDVDYSLGGIRIGFDAGEGPVSFGASLAYQGGNISGGSLQADLTTAQLDAYLLRRFSTLFAGIEAGASITDFSDVERATGFPTVTADSDTQSIDYTIAATLGAQYELAGLTLTPAVRVGYASINLDGFSEAAPVLALDYGDREVTTGFWTARLRASAPLPGTQALIAYGEIGYEDLFSTEDGYTAKLARNTAHAVNIEGDLEARGVYLKAGVGGVVDGNIRLSGEYGLSLQDGDNEVHSGRLRLSIPLSAGALAGDDAPLK
jgi:outer membrane lipase/esterase